MGTATPHDLVDISIVFTPRERGLASAFDQTVEVILDLLQSGLVHGHIADRYGHHAAQATYLVLARML
tara:strand:+ start:232 stop:435 length:204 start_codon:yes stop_codon:yes gene_type:complete